MGYVHERELAEPDEPEGATGKVQIVMTVVPRKRLPDVLKLIETHHPGAFYAVDELQSSSDGVFPEANKRPSIVPAPLFKLVGKRMLRLLSRQSVGENL